MGTALSVGCWPHSTDGTANSTSRLQTVIRRFSRDDDIMWMRLSQPCNRVPHELGFGPQRGDITDPAIAHSAPQSTDHLEDDVGDGAPVGYATLNPLRHKLLERDFALLEVPVGRAFF